MIDTRRTYGIARCKMQSQGRSWTTVLTLIVVCGLLGVGLAAVEFSAPNGESDGYISPSKDTHGSRRILVDGELIIVLDVRGDEEGLRQIIRRNNGTIRVWDTYRDSIFIRVWFPDDGAGTLERISEEIRSQIRGVLRASPHDVPL